MENTPSTVSDVITAMTSAFSTMAGDAMNGIASVLPVVLPILGAIIVIGIIIKIVRRITGR